MRIGSGSFRVLLEGGLAGVRVNRVTYSAVFLSCGLRLRQLGNAVHFAPWDLVLLEPDLLIFSHTQDP